MCCSAAIQYHRKNENMQNPHIPAINVQVQGFHGILKTLSNEPQPAHFNFLLLAIKHAEKLQNF